MRIDVESARAFLRGWRRPLPRQVTPEAQVAPPATAGTAPAGVIEPTNVFSPAELQQARERLNAGDGLHQLLARFGGEEASDSSLPMPIGLTAPGFLRRHRASIATVILYLVFAVVPGLLISVFDERFATGEFVKLTDWRELPGALFLYLVLAPVIWTFYLWQPRLIVEVFDGLARSGAIGPAQRTDITADAVLRRIGGSFVETAARLGPLRLSKGTLVALLSLTASIATLLIWPPTALPPFDRILPETDLFWWRVIPAYFWAV